MNQNTEIH